MIYDYYSPYYWTRIDYYPPEKVIDRWQHHFFYKSWFKHYNMCGDDGIDYND